MLRKIKDKIMSNRRDLKKLINNSMDLLYTDCVFYSAFTKDANLDKANDLIEDIAKVHNELISRLSTLEGKGLKDRTKAYYKKLNDDLRNHVNKFGSEIEALG